MTSKSWVLRQHISLCAWIAVCALLSVPGLLRVNNKYGLLVALAAGPLAWYGLTAFWWKSMLAGVQQTGAEMSRDSKVWTFDHASGLLRTQYESIRLRRPDIALPELRITEEPRAWAIFDRKKFTLEVTKGKLALLDGDVAALLGTIAHECGHAMDGRLRFAVLILILPGLAASIAAAVIAAVFGNDVTMHLPGWLMKSSIAAAAFLTLLFFCKFMRTAEFIADANATMLIGQAEPVIRMLEVGGRSIERPADLNMPMFMWTHPPTRFRIAALRNLRT